jgi:hypothetical protein
MSGLPTKLLQVELSSITENEAWFDPNNPSPWDYASYKWNIDGFVNTQTHGSDKTPEPFLYSGLDIKVDDWFTDDVGRCFKIVEITSTGFNNVSLVIEDTDRFNTFRDPSGSGNGAPNSFRGFVFSLTENGLPDLQNVPTGSFSPEIFTNIVSRFDSKNLVSEFVSFYQSNGGFVLGDFIKVDEENEGRFELCSADEINLAIGIINGVDAPKTDYFTFKPLTEIVNNVEPPLVGNYGDIFYLDPLNPGKVTNIKPESNPKPVYIRLETDNRAVRLNAIVDENSETISVEVPVTALDQITFVLPTAAKNVQVMSINGIENKNFTFDAVSKVVTFDPIATGYGVEESDEVIFVYNT